MVVAEVIVDMVQAVVGTMEVAEDMAEVEDASVEVSVVYVTVERTLLIVKYKSIRST